LSIYVEIRVRGDLENLWQHTQDPSLHERWDLRFTSIGYLAREGDEPQRFRYETRLGFGLRIAGEGESTGNRDGSAGERTSALRFWSNDRKSLIREGSGYWQYVPVGEETRFLTWYDYETRFGAVGRAIDKILFRPLIGWATAWSFDRLRLWIEKGADPAISIQRFIVHAIARLGVGAVFLYEGLVPKLIYRHPSELAMLTDAGLGIEAAARVVTGIGFLEIVLGAFVLFGWRTRWPFAVILAAMPIALVAVFVTSPAALTAAFNPVALNAAVAALAAIGWMTSSDLPTARHCLRVRPQPDRVQSA
jgi:uncharacterized membrane protein YphA (DoxX/SURF4 family)